MDEVLTNLKRQSCDLGYVGGSSLESIRYIFANTTEHSPLRVVQVKNLISNLAWDDFSKDPQLDNVPDFYAEVSRQAIKALRESTRLISPWEQVNCTYHVHPEGQRCSTKVCINFDLGYWICELDRC